MRICPRLIRKRNWQNGGGDCAVLGKEEEVIQSHKGHKNAVFGWYGVFEGGERGYKRLKKVLIAFCKSFRLVYG